MNEKSLGLFQRVVGEQLSSVEFVQDYVQLRFDGPTLTAYVWPVVKSSEGTVRFGEPDYRNVLCGRIGHKILAVSVEEEKAINLRFDDGSQVSVSLRPEDHSGPEAGTFRVINDPRAPTVVF